MRHGDFESAWRISDQSQRYFKDLPRHLQPVWRGLALKDKHVLIRCYRGLGDTIQFVRYAPHARPNTQGMYRVIAIAELERAIAAAPNVVTHVPLLPAAWTAEPEHCPTVDDVLQAIGAANFELQAHHMLGGLFLDDGRYELAEYHLDAVADDGTQTVFGYEELADRYAGLGRHLDAARAYAVKRIIYTSSGAVYGESLYRLARLYEDSPAVPVTLYGITKFAAERLCLRMQALWEVDVVCARLGTVVGPWERDTGVRDSYGTHTQLAGLALSGGAAVLTPREVRRDWVYSRDVAAGLIALMEAPRLRHRLYNLSAGVEWNHPIRTWCERLRSVYPDFDFRVADPGETANIWYTDQDRCPMDIGRISQDIGFVPRYTMDTAYSDFLEWLERTPEMLRR